MVVRQRRGRPKRRLGDCISNDMEVMGLERMRQETAIGKDKQPASKTTCS